MQCACAGFICGTLSGSPDRSDAAADGRASIDFGVYGAPENFLVNPEGIIVKKWFGLTAKTWNDARQEFLAGVKP